MVRIVARLRPWPESFGPNPARVPRPAWHPAHGAAAKTSLPAVASPGPAGAGAVVAGAVVAGAVVAASAARRGEGGDGQRRRRPGACPQGVTATLMTPSSWFENSW